MAELLSMQTRRGVGQHAYTCDPGRNSLTLVAQFGKVPDGVGFSFLIEQLVGDTWCVFGGADIPPDAGGLAAILSSPNRDGTDRAGRLEWRFHEQLVRDAKGQDTTRRYKVNGADYQQLAICPSVRLTFETYVLQGKGERAPADLDYSVDLVASDKPLPGFALPIIGKG